MKDYERNIEKQIETEQLKEKYGNVSGASFFTIFAHFCKDKKTGYWPIVRPADGPMDGHNLL